MKRILPFCSLLILSFHIGSSQEYIRNGSFEGIIPQSDGVPPFWDICKPHSTPDIQPINSFRAASDGVAYMGLAVRGQNPANASLRLTAEAIGQEIEPLTPQFEYLISVHLTYDRNHRSGEGESETPGKLNVYIGNGICFDTLRIWQSPLIDHDDWKVYERNYVASCFNNYIILEADHGDIIAQEAAYLLIDMVSIIPINNGSSLDTVKCEEVLEIPDTIEAMEDFPCTIFVPNAYTPNFDGINDEFSLGLNCDVSDFSFRLYDRWGGLVYQATRPDFIWSDADLDPGPYLYQLCYTYRDEKGSARSNQMNDVIYVIR